MTTGVSRGCVLGAVFLKIFVNVIDKGIEGILSRFPDVTEQRGAVAQLKDRMPTREMWMYLRSRTKAILLDLKK